MILVDFSSIIHRKIHSSIAQLKLKPINGSFETDKFIGLAIYNIITSLFEIQQKFGNKYGDIIICLDRSDGGYWRKDVYPAYKMNRSIGREESEINFGEVFLHINKLIDQLKKNVPWKVVEVSRAEADDIMLVLSREFNKSEIILIHSPDKDMIQAQQDTDNVFQYSGLTNKFLVAEHKNDSMERWILEHVCLGDASDGVPRIIDHTKFSKNFLNYLKEHGYNINNPMEFKESNIPTEEKKSLLSNFNVYKTNRKGESTGEIDVYEKERFGMTNVDKMIQKYGSLDNWLDSHPLYRKHYERNYALVMEEGIPQDIKDKIIEAFKDAKIDYNQKEFEEYLKENNQKTIILELPNYFKLNRELTLDDFGW